MHLYSLCQSRLKLKTLCLRQTPQTSCLTTLRTLAAPPLLTRWPWRARGRTAAPPPPPPGGGDYRDQQTRVHAAPDRRDRAVDAPATMAPRSATPDNHSQWLSDGDQQSAISGEGGGGRGGGGGGSTGGWRGGGVPQNTSLKMIVTGGGERDTGAARQTSAMSVG